MTTSIHFKVANDRRVETERFLRTFDSQTGAFPRLHEHGNGGTSAVFLFDFPNRRAVSALTS
jgi:hypothetical protein